LLFLIFLLCFEEDFALIYFQNEEVLFVGGSPDDFLLVDRQIAFDVHQAVAIFLIR